MRIVIIFLLLANGVSLYSQKSLEGGVLAGGLYYLGEINPNQQVHLIKPSAGLFLRQNLNKRWAVRASFIAGSIAADDKEFDNGFQQQRNINFNSSLLDISAQAEFNFFPYKLGATRHTSSYTPYVASGFGFLLVSNSIEPYNIVIPMSVGVKISITKKIEIGAELSVKKTFSDYLDNLSGKEYELAKMESESKIKYKQKATFYKKDWYTFVGVFITYKIFQSGGVCKAYDF